MSSYMQPPEPVPFSDEEFFLKAGLKHLAEQCQSIKLSPLLLKQIERAQKTLTVSTAEETNKTLYALTELSRSVLDDLKTRSFYSVAEDRAGLISDPEPFGPAVGTRFSKAAGDIRAGGRCLALGEWTGSVFHCMRALEHGLRFLARKAGVTMTTKLELENWKNIIDQIEAAIRAQEKATKSVAKINRLKFFSSAAVQFRYFKDAWRNHVAHARVSYDEAGAESIWTHTRGFLQSLADAPPRKRKTRATP